jgi:hypothetical protein
VLENRVMPKGRDDSGRPRRDKAYAQSPNATYAREDIDLDVSTPADWVGAAGATLMPLTEAITSWQGGVSMPTTRPCQC